MTKLGLILATFVVVSPLSLAQINSVQAKTQLITQAQTNPPAASINKIFTNLINSIAQNNYNQFVSQGNTAFKEALKKETFAQVSSQLAPRLKKGYTTTFFGRLNQQGYQVYLWKLTFKDSGDDILARLSIKDGKVGGFWLN